ncbi:MAG: hypothetical protein ABIC40_07490 [bacterium]
MVTSEKTALAMKQMVRMSLIFAGILVLACVVYLILPGGSPAGNQKKMNDIEYRDEISKAGDAYLLGKTAEDRQAAARKIRSIKAKQNSTGNNPKLQTVTLLRAILIVTIVLLGYKLIRLLIAMVKITGAQKARES